MSDLPSKDGVKVDDLQEEDEAPIELQVESTKEYMVASNEFPFDSKIDEQDENSKVESMNESETP